MAALSLDQSAGRLQIDSDQTQHGPAVEEIEGLIRVYKDGHVERPQVVPSVGVALASDIGVISEDTVIDKVTKFWARLYVPVSRGKVPLPILVYFHGGGFCVGSAAWSCYHDFLAQLSAKASCLILSVEYRLAPENKLPAAYDDGFKAVMWLKQLAQCGSSQWWLSRCNFSSVFLAGDSAGANIAYNVAIRLSSAFLKPLDIKGLILIQPFFGGEARTNTEKYLAQPARSALSLAASDTYWRLALPSGSSRDHSWSNPLAKLENLRVEQIMVCISEMDILKDRNLEFCGALGRGGKRVEQVVYKGVGHAFQVLDRSQLSQIRTLEMMSHIKAFIGYGS
ncbi:Alpha/beta hydrolase fold-3 [Dillenia turbinata]|uniref:Alpha/beta hydrolase fold-3 n=1 Tax=Dillenia turbinata TaxID=194707 RepID=A0AAN8UYW1_9MAGN